MTDDMTDTELMLLAAKAAGIRLEWIGDIALDCTNLKPGKPASKGKMWWPLVDDGDALRLAVKLRLQVTPGTYNSDEFTVYRAGYAECHEHVHYQQDQCAATRRAIVRAAAEIGKAVQKPLAP